MLAASAKAVAVLVCGLGARLACGWLGNNSESLGIKTGLLLSGQPQPGILQQQYVNLMNIALRYPHSFGMLFALKMPPM